MVDYDEHRACRAQIAELQRLLREKTRVAAVYIREGDHHCGYDRVGRVESMQDTPAGVVITVV